MSSKTEILERERRFALPTALITMLAVVLIVGSRAMIASTDFGNGDADYLNAIESIRSNFLISYILFGIGSGLLAVPLVYLFKAAGARNPAVRQQLFAAIVIAPILIMLGWFITGAAELNAASTFKNDSAAAIETKTIELLKDDKSSSGATGSSGSTGSSGTTGRSGASGSAGTTGSAALLDAPGADGATGSSGTNGSSGDTGSTGNSGATGASGAADNVAGTGSTVSDVEKARTEAADDVAKTTRADAGMRPLALGLQLAGALGFLFAIVYTSLQSMRIGLLTRFWGSLGIALGVVSILPNMLPFLMVWFIYIGLLIAGWVPRGRPPAWAAGEAIPWQSAGDRAAKSMGHDIDGEGTEIEPVEGDPIDADLGTNGSGTSSPGRTSGNNPRKRKRRR